MAEVNEGRVRGRPRLDWMDGVKVALSIRGMTVEAARRCAKNRKEWRALVHMLLNEFHAAIFAWPSVPSDPLPCSGDYHLERGIIPLQDAVGINCKNGATTENQGAGVKCVGLGAYVGRLYVCYLTWHDYPSLVEGESQGILFKIAI